MSVALDMCPNGYIPNARLCVFDNFFPLDPFDQSGGKFVVGNVFPSQSFYQLVSRFIRLDFRPLRNENTFCEVDDSAVAEVGKSRLWGCCVEIRLENRWRINGRNAAALGIVHCLVK